MHYLLHSFIEISKFNRMTYIFQILFVGVIHIFSFNWIVWIKIFLEYRQEHFTFQLECKLRLQITSWCLKQTDLGFYILFFETPLPFRLWSENEMPCCLDVTNISEEPAAWTFL